MFDRCEFLMGEDTGIVMVLEGHLPAGAPNYTISASPNRIRIRAGLDEIASFSYSNTEVFDRLSHSSQIGIVEFPPEDYFPNAITAVAFVETRLH